MKILYKQPDTSENIAFSCFEIMNLYLKKLSIKQDSFTIAKKEHHHTCFEIHIITSGEQTYKIDETEHRITNGHLLLVPPATKHRLVNFSQETEKFSITFTTDNMVIKNKIKHCINCELPKRIIENLTFIESEKQNKLKFTSILIENAIFETIVQILRLCGVTEETASDDFMTENLRLALAKQYVKDNIELSPSVADISKYCNLSPKQLTRLFYQSDGITPLTYIQRQKIKLIQKLLTDDTLSLKEISEKLNFNNEYYFNTFFKKYAGMPPGEYRAMHK